jgi:flagellar protein FlaF
VNASLRARNAYGSTQMATSSPRSLETQLLGSVTVELRKAATNIHDFPKLASAVHRNRQMWTTFATNVADKDNALPEELRAQLFYLAEFTEVHSRKVLKGEASIDPIVDINMSILRGLSASEMAK